MLRSLRLRNSTEAGHSTVLARLNLPGVKFMKSRGLSRRSQSSRVEIPYCDSVNCQIAQEILLHGKCINQF
jgi:hypothetical protein